MKQEKPRARRLAGNGERPLLRNEGRRGTATVTGIAEPAHVEPDLAAVEVEVREVIEAEFLLPLFLPLFPLFLLFYCNEQLTLSHRTSLLCYC